MAGLPSAAALDCTVVFAAYLFAAGVRTGGRLDAPSAGETAAFAVLAGVFQVAANLAFAVYWRDWSVAALEDLVALFKATVVAFGFLLFVDTITEPHVIPYAALFSGYFIVVFAQAALKLQPRWGQIVRVALTRQTGETVIIVGAGRTGQLLARDLLQHAVRQYRIVAFVDDDPAKQGRYLRGIRVAGRIGDLHSLIDALEVSLVVVAVSQPPGDLVREVVTQCEESDVRISAVAGVRIDVSDTRALRPLSIDELLGRESVDLDTPLAREFLAGKRVLITGAAGSIGSELARQVSRLGPAQLLLLDTNESGLFEVRQQLTMGEHACRIELSDIRNSASLNRLFLKARPQVVFHAAAYKHVPILEEAVCEGIDTNVLGTRNAIAASLAADVEHFVFISTDKAVNPENVLGLTKRFGELLTVATATKSGRPYCAVRFGNVLGSTGSVVPIFEHQIDVGGPVTVTHPETTRYFMTIPEAVGLVIQAGAIAMPGDVLVLDMGTPVPIVDLARKMIRLRGLRTPGDVDIVYTGLRPGEKLHEELLFATETRRPTKHPRVFRAARHDIDVELAGLEQTARTLQRLTGEGDQEAALSELRMSVRPPTAYESQGIGQAAGTRGEPE